MVLHAHVLRWFDIDGKQVFWEFAGKPMSAQILVLALRLPTEI